VNDRSAEVDVAEDMPLLYVLANALDLKGPRFGCGLAAVTVYFGRGEFGQGTLTGMML
jgi:aerobic-type carbon monoxide dehydrogenase small subunit (CoxS/CutS family)